MRFNYYKKRSMDYESNPKHKKKDKILKNEFNKYFKMYLVP